SPAGHHGQSRSVLPDIAGRRSGQQYSPAADGAIQQRPGEAHRIEDARGAGMQRAVRGKTVRLLDDLGGPEFGVQVVALPEGDFLLQIAAMLAVRGETNARTRGKPGLFRK